MNWNGRRILVTGAGGFIGSHLTEKLAALGARVTAFVHYNSRNSWGLLEHLNNNIKKNIKVTAGDICDPHMLKNICKGKEIVFHLAALIPIPYSYIAPASFIQTNAMGSLNLFKACLDANVNRIVHTSSSETYGTAEYVPIDEKHPLKAQSPYAASKIAADKIAESFYYSYGAAISIIRPFNTFGPRQSARAIIPAIISQMLSEKKEVMLGSTHPVRDFTYIEDTVCGFLAVAESPKSIGEVVNIGSGKGISIRELLMLISNITNCRKRVRKEQKRVRRKGSEVDRLVCDNRKALRLCNWKSIVNFREGLKKTLEYIECNMHLYKPDEYVV